MSVKWGEPESVFAREWLYIFLYESLTAANYLSDPAQEFHPTLYDIQQFDFWITRFTANMAEDSPEWELVKVYKLGVLIDKQLRSRLDTA